MNEVGLHTFIGECSLETLGILFPPSKTRYISAEVVKHSVVFEESAGHEETIVLFFEYLAQLEKYEPGTKCIVLLVNLLPQYQLKLYTRKNAQLVTNLQQTCCKLVGTSLLGQACWDKLVARFVRTASSSLLTSCDKPAADLLQA